MPPTPPSLSNVCPLHSLTSPHGIPQSQGPKLLPNFCPQLYGDRVLYDPTVSILLCGVVPSPFCNYIALEILLFNAQNVVQLEIPMKRGALARSLPDVVLENGSERVGR